MKKIELVKVAPDWVVAVLVSKRNEIYQVVSSVSGYCNACLFAEVYSTQNRCDVAVIEKRTGRIDVIYHGEHFLSDRKPFCQYVGREQQ